MIKDKTQTFRNALSAFSVRLVLVLSLTFSLIFTYWAGFYTLNYPDYSAERLSGGPDSPFRNLLFFIGAAVLLYLLYRLIFHGSEAQRHRLVHGFAIAQCLITGVLLFFWVTHIRAVPMWDQRWIYDAVLGFRRGDYSAMRPDEYLGIHHHQYGLALLLELLFSVTGNDRYQLFQFCNIGFIMLTIYFSYRLAEELFHDAAVSFYTLLLLLLCVPLYLYSTYVYGDVLTIMAGVIVFWAALRWCRTGKKRYAAVMLALMTVSTLARKNTLILILALALMLLVYAIKNGQLRHLALAALLLALPLSATRAVIAFYEARSGIPQENGIPSEMYIALGLQESENGCVYSSYGLNTYVVDAGLDQEVCSEIGREYIRGRLKEFLSNPQTAYRFYSTKELAQWNDQTFSSFYLTAYFEESPSGFLGSVYYGEIHNALTKLLDRYLFLVYLGIALCALYLLGKRPELPVCTVFIAFVGGVLFSVLWEAKGRYVLPYVIFALPCASMGIRQFQILSREIFRRVRRLISDRRASHSSSIHSGAR